MPSVCWLLGHAWQPSCFWKNTREKDEDGYSVNYTRFHCARCPATKDVRQGAQHARAARRRAAGTP